MFIIFLILNEFSCGKVENFEFIAATEYLSVLCYVLYFLQKFEQMLSYTARACVGK